MNTRHIYLRFVLASALVTFGASYPLLAQDIKSETDKSASKTVSSESKQNVGKNVIDVLRSAGTHKTFLSLLEQSELAPLLRGAERDSASAEVKFGEVKNVDTVSDIKIEVEGGMEIPEEMLEGLKAQILAQFANNKPPAPDIKELLLTGKITVFAPTDSAFAALPAATLDSLKNDRAARTRFLRKHLVNVGFEPPVLMAITSLQSMDRTTLPVSVDGTGNVKVSGVAVGSNLSADNGTVFSVNSVFR